MTKLAGNNYSISAIVPTIGRAHSLVRLLESLCAQTRPVDEVIIADGSNDNETSQVVENTRWHDCGLPIQRIVIHPPNAVRQREAAIRVSHGELLLLLDDDVELEPECVERLLTLLITSPEIVGVTADFNNQSWSQPTQLWRLYLRYVLGLSEKGWQGRVIGPLLRFGYNPVPTGPQPMEWLGSGNSLVRRSAYIRAGGFSDFFLHRCTINEDVDLSLKLSRVGQLLFCPAARMAHHHAPSGRVSPNVAAEDDLFNRFMVMHTTLNFSKLHALALVVIYFTLESASNILGAIRRVRLGTSLELLRGRFKGLGRICQACFSSKAENAVETLL